MSSVEEEFTDAATVSSPTESLGLLFLLAVVSVALGWILWPFYGAVLWGAIIAMLFSPVYRRLLLRMKERRTPAALLTMMLVLLVVVVPFGLVTASLSREAMAIQERIQSGEVEPGLYFRSVFNALPDWVGALLDRFGLVNFDVLQRRLSEVMAQGSKLIATQALNIGQITFDFLVNLFIALYLAFFLIRDGNAVVGLIQRAIPLPPGHRKDLIDKFTTVVRATVKGNVLVAVIQGALGGIAFWFLGISGAMLWAVLMAFLSLLPAVGAGLVWAPVAIYCLLKGAVWQGIMLTAYGVLVIGLVDNLLRPLLVGKDTRMPDYVVMITTIGGMAVMGINGFVLGPAIAAMFIAVWHIYIVTRPAAKS